MSSLQFSVILALKSRVMAPFRILQAHTPFERPFKLSYTMSITCRDSIFQRD